jgi:hypothetical protein
VTFNPCHLQTPCWADDAAITLHDVLNASRGIPDPPLEEPLESGGQPGVLSDLPQAGCLAAEWTWHTMACRPCQCPLQGWHGTRPIRWRTPTRPGASIPAELGGSPDDIQGAGDVGAVAGLPARLPPVRMARE